MNLQKKKFIKEHIGPWFRLIREFDRGNERYYLHKAMRIFLDFPAGHQSGLLHFIVEKIPNERWQKNLEDNTRYLDVIRSVLYFYTGREDLGQPSMKNFQELLVDYLKSSNYLKAETEPVVIDAPEEESFTEMLGAL